MVNAPNTPQGKTPQRKKPPELPNALVDLAPVAIVGTLVWLAVLGASLVLRHLFDREVGNWPATALAGCALGVWGLSIVAWQRRASRRGSRGAQRGL